MNKRIQELAEQCKETFTTWYDGRGNVTETYFDKEKFAELIVKECLNTLEFHGFDDAIPYIKWMATNKLGVKV